ncbi:hypothetical protein FE257_012206 [Aspergillus nanangensis]|uniref:Uncharacterized protein n=1 Tax=Aspergillus nanangensis TaxID=2582783 RepID=A0AAD4CG67_ASPNN|nr:hypothetical protein FE257_012206 [Aspergillus nanangensis]
MTSGPSLAFSTMEIPGIDDNMEMASPYQAHVDDLDIDLDVMEDQASTTDKDMMGDDEYHQGTGFELDGTTDADMIDDIVEQAMIDTDEHYHDTDYNIEMQYGTDKTYEAEMLEDDYDEDIDTSVEVTAHDAPPADEPQNNLGTALTEPHQTLKHDGPGSSMGSHLETKVHSVLESSQEKEENATDHNIDAEDASASDQPHEITQPPANQTETFSDKTDIPDQADRQPEPDGHDDVDDDDYVNVEPAEQGEEDVPASEAAVTGKAEAEIRQAEEKTDWEANEQEAEEDQTQAQGHEQAVGTTDETQALYPVKVYYQENEISLFPPREGDSSETFFLEDENLAREPLNMLFTSCREVLGDHIGDNEVLVMDVDSLNDSTHVSKVTLCQIVDLYLHLCRNDGIDEPEALYLTLSTRLTIAAEISDLLLAANEGKGLSEIPIWDGYQEGDAVSTELLSGNNDQQPVANPRDEDVSAEGENQEALVDDSNTEINTEPSKIEIRNPEEARPDLQHEHDQESEEDGEIRSNQENEEFVPLDNKHETIRPVDDVFPVVEEDQKADANSNEPHNELEAHHTTEDGSYDSEEQHTESTTTISQLPTTEQQDNSADFFDDDHEAHGGEDEFDEYEAEDEEYLKGEYNPNDTEDHDNFDPAEKQDYHEEEFDPNGREDHIDEAEENNFGDDYGNDETDLYLEESYEEDAQEYDQCLVKETVADPVPKDNGDGTEEALQADDPDTLHQVSKPLDPSHNESVANSSQPDLNKNFLGVIDNVNSPPKELSADSKAGPSHESQDTHDKNELAPAKEENEQLIFDDEEFLDLGFTEELDVNNEEPGTKPLGSASIKRQRDPEDELELPDSPSPDAKRSRSS